MTNSFFRILAVIPALMAVSAPVFAQNCDVDYEQVFRFSDPGRGSHSVWSRVHGDRDLHERFVSTLLHGDILVSVGEQFADEEGDRTLIVAGKERRGRIVWLKEHKIEGLREVKKILPLGEEFLIVGNKVNDKGEKLVWFGFSNDRGELLRQKDMHNRRYDLSAQDAIIAHDGKSFMLVTSFDERAGSKANHSVVYKVNDKGDIVSGPAYMPGNDSKILGISPLDEGHYVATGYMVGADGRKTGWALKISGDGNIVWQRQYPRGRSAELTAAHGFMGRYIVIAGEVQPALVTDGRSTNAAGWLMMVDSHDGNAGWQRFYTGDVNYAARDLMVRDDNVVVLLLAASPSETTDKKYLRVLNVDPRGALLRSDEYFNGEGAEAFELGTGPAGEVIIAGYTDAVYQVEAVGQAEAVEKRSLDAWVLAGLPYEEYADPCVQRFGPM